MKHKVTQPIVVLLAILGLGALLISGCGSSGADADSDPQELLDKTFGGDGEAVSSGVLNISVDASSTGAGGGSLSGTLTGPFETRESDQLPLLDVAASLKVDNAGEKTDFEGALTLTGDSAFVTVDGQAYAVDEATFDTFSQIFAESAAQQDEEAEQGSAVFDTLGVDPAAWLTDVTNEGVEEVGGVETIHISGTADVAQIVADAQALDPTGNAVDAPGGGELAEAVSAASVDVFTGADDNLLRQLDLEIAVDDPDKPAGGLTLSLSIGIADVNEEQTFEAPADAQPLEDLIPGGLAAVAGGLGGSSGGSAPGGAGGGTGGLGGFTPEYQECVSQAQTPEDVADCNAQQ